MLIALTIAAALAQADAGEVLDEAHRRDAARVRQLNRAALHGTDPAPNAAAQDAYRRARNRYEAALAENARARAQADAEAQDYAAARADHAAEMARWRAQVEAQRDRSAPW